MYIYILYISLYLFIYTFDLVALPDTGDLTLHFIPRLPGPNLSPLPSLWVTPSQPPLLIPWHPLNGKCCSATGL